jgi:hypothetical protein
MHPPWLLLPSIEPSDPPCSPSPGFLYTFPASYHHHRVSIRFFFAKSSERTREPGGLAREQQKTYTHTHTHSHPGSPSSSISYADENWIPGHHHLCSLCRRFPGDQGSPTCTPLSTCITERLFFSFPQVGHVEPHIELYGRQDGINQFNLIFHPRRIVYALVL